MMINIKIMRAVEILNFLFFMNFNDYDLIVFVLEKKFKLSILLIRRF